MKDSAKINFLGIGAQKSGTTWLFKNLQDIELFDLPPIKEFHYFDRFSYYPTESSLSEPILSIRLRQRGYLEEANSKIFNQLKEKNYKLAKFYFKWYYSNYSDQWYKSLFEVFDGYTGEITPSYSILEKRDIKRIYKLLPDIKIILMLRNPIDRSWSHCRFKFGNKLEKMNYQEILEFIKSKEHQLRSNYLRTIDNWQSIFSDQQILIGFYDAIINSPSLLIKKIVSHISGVEKINLNPKSLKKVINSSLILSCQPGIMNYLKDLYYNQISELSNNFGGYFSVWYNNSYASQKLPLNFETKPTIII